MSTSKPTPRNETTASAKPDRRRWTDDEKLKIVEESLDDGVLQAQLGGSTEFSEVLVTEETTDSDQPSSAVVGPDLFVEVGRQYRLTIPAGFDMDAAARLLRALA